MQTSVETTSSAHDLPNVRVPSNPACRQCSLSQIDDPKVTCCKLTCAPPASAPHRQGSTLNRPSELAAKSPQAREYQEPPQWCGTRVLVTDTNWQQVHAEIHRDTAPISEDRVAISSAILGTMPHEQTFTSKHSLTIVDKDGQLPSALSNLQDTVKVTKYAFQPMLHGLELRYDACNTCRDSVE